MAAPGYTVSNAMAGTEQAISSSYKTITRLVVPASSGKRVYVWEIDVSHNAAPNATDCAVEWAFVECDATTAGTGTAATPYGTGAPGDTAVTTAKVNFTVEPTAYTQAQDYWHKAPNQRGTALWQAAPGGELWFATTASTGPGLKALSTNYTGTGIGLLRFSEV